ncbi:MAG: hypothetical protein JW768_13460 [Chitinispirillaceae bacterium]|nr:hypothetical protein [Chitinispirillaceae bacterium]
MKRINSCIACTAVATLLLSSGGFSQTTDSYNGPKLEYRAKRLSGPRMGLSFAIPDGKELQRELRENGMGPFLSQFGWHFEWIVEPQNGGPAFVIEAIPFIGGVEYSTVVPSLSLVMGVRLPSGFEFGMGPMGYYTGDEQEPVGSSLVVAVGKSLDFSGVSIPLNLAIATSPAGTRVSFVFGYAITRS